MPSRPERVVSNNWIDGPHAGPKLTFGSLSGDLFGVRPGFGWRLESRRLEVWTTQLAVASSRADRCHHGSIGGQSAAAFPYDRGVCPATEARAAALCGESLVVLQQSTQPCTTRNGLDTIRCPTDGEEQPVAYALMVAFVMIVLHEFVDRVLERAFADEDQLSQTRFLDRPDEAFRIRVEIGRSRWRTVSTPAADNVSANASVNRGSRSWRRSRFSRRHPSSGSVSWRPHWITHALSGSRWMPAMSTRRVATSITNKTANRVSPLAVQTSTEKKSAAARTSRCRPRNSSQVVRRWRSGAGSIPCCFSMLAIVARLTWSPRLASAPWIRV